MTDYDVNKIIDFSKANSLVYPVVLGADNQKKGQLELLMTKEDLANCGGDHSQFLELLRAKAAEKSIPLDSPPMTTGTSL